MNDQEAGSSASSPGGDLRPNAAARAGPRPSPAPVLVSVVIPCFGQLEYTRLCVPSLIRHSRHPCEFLFVDGGSLDGTPEYLAGLQAGAPVRVEVLGADEEAGLAAAFDLGLSRAQGGFVVLLSGDTVVVSGWLNQLTGLAGLDPKIGAVGPMSNYASPPQLVRPVPYRVHSRIDQASLPQDDLDRFALGWREQHKGEWQEADRLDTFCLLFKREVLEKIGPLDRLAASADSRSRLRIVDPSGLGQAVRRAGAKMACCRDLFIHHFGSRLGILGGGEKAVAGPVGRHQAEPV
jgi:O-antigen biosynthesis protein